MQDVKRWLTEIGFAKYEHNFEEEGYDDIPTILEIKSVKDLEDIKIPAEDRMKILNEVVILYNKHYNVNNNVDTKKRDVGKNLKQLNTSISEKDVLKFFQKAGKKIATETKNEVRKELLKTKSSRTIKDVSAENKKGKNGGQHTRIPKRLKTKFSRKRTTPNKNAMNNTTTANTNTTSFNGDSRQHAHTMGDITYQTQEKIMGRPTVRSFCN